MATAISPSLRASLERLKHAGAINGACLFWRRQVLVSLMPYEDYRVELLVQTLNDARDHFQSSAGGRQIESLWMAYLDVHVQTVYSGECGVIFLHVRPEESDFISSVAKTFLNDVQLLVAGALNPPGSPQQEGAETDSESVDWPPQPPNLDPNETNMVV